MKSISIQMNKQILQILLKMKLNKKEDFNLSTLKKTKKEK